MSRVDLNGIGMTSQRTRERLIQRLVDQGISNQAVLDVIRITPRHLFLDEAMAHRAYEDVALPIGFQQTLSQPYIVARMTELLLQGGTPGRVLEIGTGSGYQTAILAQLVDEVYSVERIKPLQQKARQRMRQLKLRNVHMNHADGGMGWVERGPFDGILAAAAPERIPQGLLEQLAPGGRLVIPVGGDTQYLHVVDRTHEGFETTVVEAVNFVPLRPGTVR
ncbi:protein-L-isoaspartate(D-aspartate) O-methyltransferase [Seongchinamella sediminis]|uniref:Protein-L-isoaspartate O-methyltransferase n=1 Tax=Seongchinamella sediminis TaxID=2283635 RepID=A0A3L7E2Y3_9GAMM|nr:protein-L-isoaspartate(D-aspartate) O-methyltransferase [Seongchinamella sediminis]RLQ22773.1 protein-L-isoaspartate(D-aspartate) O-methyltransferase [Seongchinamella sediminis]